MESSELISDSLKCATILGFAPKAVEQNLRAAAPQVRRDYKTMRENIREFLLGQHPASFVPKPPAAADSDAMD
eukprot:10387509-Alexandrium_andersonii.AAC.1